MTALEMVEQLLRILKKKRDDAGRARYPYPSSKQGQYYKGVWAGLGLAIGGLVGIQDGLELSIRMETEETDGSKVR